MNSALLNRYTHILEPGWSLESKVHILYEMKTTSRASQYLGTGVDLGDFLEPAKNTKQVQTPLPRTIVGRLRRQRKAGSARNTDCCNVPSPGDGQRFCRPDALAP